MVIKACLTPSSLPPPWGVGGGSGTRESGPWIGGRCRGRRRRRRREDSGSSSSSSIFSFALVIDLPSSLRTKTFLLLPFFWKEEENNVNRTLSKQRREGKSRGKKERKTNSKSLLAPPPSVVRKVSLETSRQQGRKGEVSVARRRRSALNWYKSFY